MRDDLGGSRPKKGAKMKVQTIYVGEQPSKHLVKQDVAKLNQLEEGNLMKRLKKRMKISPRGLEEKTESLQGTFLYDQLLPILQRFILIGALPIQRQANGRVTAKLCSVTSLYCLCVYLLSLPLLLMTGRDMVQHALVSVDFDEILMSQLFSTILIPYLRALDAKLVSST